MWTFADMAYLLLAPITIFILYCIIDIAREITWEETGFIFFSVFLALSASAGIILLAKQ